MPFLSRLFFECVACRTPLANPRKPACSACLSGLIPAPALCQSCGALDCGPDACLSPATPLLHQHPLREVRARYIGSGAGYTLMKRWKRGQGTALERLLLPPLTEAIPYSHDGASRIVPIPQRLERSYSLGGSPAAKIAQWLECATGIPVESGSWQPIRRRADATEGHTAELGLSQRVQLLPRFAWTGGRAPRHVLLVDDVMTSGKTLRDTADELARAGTESFSVFVLAVRPRRSRPNLQTRPMHALPSQAH